MDTLLDSFGLLQNINKSTHVLGHTLDLFMSFAFSIDNINIEDAWFSSHRSIVFSVTLSSSLSIARTHGYYSN